MKQDSQENGTKSSVGGSVLQCYLKREESTVTERVTTGHKVRSWSRKFISSERSWEARKLVGDGIWRREVRLMRNCAYYFLRSFHGSFWGPVVIGKERNS